MRQKIKIILILVIVLALIGVSTAYMFLTPKYKTINMGGYELEVPSSNIELKQVTDNYNTYDDEKHNLTIRSWAWENINDTNMNGCYEIGDYLKNHTGSNCTYNNVSLVNKSGNYTYYTINKDGCILVITSNNPDEITHIIKTHKDSTVKLPSDINNTNITIITDINDLLQNNTNDTNTTQTQTTTKSYSKSTKKSSSDNIKSEGTYKGVDYSLHKGGYPYYSPQAGKTYHSKKEEYNDMKKIIDSGIAD